MEGRFSILESKMWGYKKWKGASDGRSELDFAPNTAYDSRNFYGGMGWAGDW